MDGAVERFITVGRIAARLNVQCGLWCLLSSYNTLLTFVLNFIIVQSIFSILLFLRCPPPKIRISKTSSAISWATSRGAHEARCQGDKNSRRPKMQYIITRSLGAPLGRGPALGQNIPLPNVRYVVDFLFWFCFRSCFNLQAKRYIFCCWVKYARMSTVWLNIERASHGCLTWNLPDCLAPASPPWSPEHFEDQSEDSGERPIGAQKLLPGRKRGKGWGLEIPFQYLTKS